MKKLAKKLSSSRFQFVFEEVSPLVLFLHRRTGHAAPPGQDEAQDLLQRVKAEPWKLRPSQGQGIIPVTLSIVENPQTLEIGLLVIMKYELGLRNFCSSNHSVPAN